MFIKRPGNGRVSYSLIGNDKKTIHDPRIDAVNKDRKLGVAPDVLEERMNQIKQSYRMKISLNAENMKIVEDCHKKKLQRKPDTIDPYALKRGLIRAVEAIGNLSLTEASADELLDKIAHIKKPGRRYHTVRALNELLRFKGRDTRLPNKNPKPDVIAFVEPEAFIARIGELEPDYATYVGALFATGARWGELPPAVFRGGTVHIDKQMDKKGVLRGTKTRGYRSAPVLPPLDPFILRLKALGSDRVKELRLSHHRRIASRFKALYGVRIHDLRHSYAIAWAKVGTETVRIASWIGNTEEVCRRHYSRYRPSDEEIENQRLRYKQVA